MSRSSVEDPDIRTDLPTGTPRIDPSRSTVSFTTRHLFGLSRVGGTFDPAGGEIRASRPIELSQVEAVAAGNFTTGNTRRDADVRSGRARIDRYDFAITGARGMVPRHLDLALRVVACTDDTSGNR